MPYRENMRNATNATVLGNVKSVAELASLSEEPRRNRNGIQVGFPDLRSHFSILSNSLFPIVGHACGGVDLHAFFDRVGEIQGVDVVDHARCHGDCSQFTHLPERIAASNLIRTSPAAARALRRVSAGTVNVDEIPVETDLSIKTA